MKQPFFNMAKSSTKALASVAMVAGAVSCLAPRAASAQAVSWYVAGDVGQSNYKIDASDVGFCCRCAD